MPPWNIEAYFGETRHYRITLADDLGVPMNLVGYTFLGKIKAVGGAGEFSLSIDTSKGATGVLTVTVPVLPVGSYVFDVVMTDIQAQSSVITHGSIRIIKGVTL